MLRTMKVTVDIFQLQLKLFTVLKEHHKNDIGFVKIPRTLTFLNTKEENILI